MEFLRVLEGLGDLQFMFQLADVPGLELVAIRCCTSSAFSAQKRSFEAKTWENENLSLFSIAGL